MAEPIEYQPRLPDGYQLRYVINEKVVSVSRDPVGHTLLWLEAGAPLILLIVFVVFAGLIWRSSKSSTPLRFAGCGTLLLMLFIIGRTAWQNMGIVMEIAVSQGTLYWRKRNLWGDKEFFWKLSSIRNVGVENRLLKVYRFRGPALAAFSFVRSEERTYAAALLKAAIQRQLHPELQ